jgi:sigma-B regulation protein RsbU (phosphoserine phosphatase)
MRGEPAFHGSSFAGNCLKAATHRSATDMREDSTQKLHSAQTDRPRILVVDDDGTSRKLLARALESAGFAAEQAADGNEALASISRSAPDVILLDLQMPGLNGAETCRFIRAQADPAIRELPVIMLTAQDDEAAEVQCLEAGANDFLAKPVGRAALTARIQTQLRLHSLTLELQARNLELERWRASQLADLEAARITQTAIIPSRDPVIPSWNLESYFEPLIQVGGDVYGWHPLGSRGCVLWIADATGHGAAAALVTTLVAHLFHQATTASHEPDRILHTVNAEFFDLFRGKSFMSAFCALLEPDGTVTFSNAGHPPMLVVRQDNSIEHFRADATMIGVTAKLNSSGMRIRLTKGDRLLVFTDGLYSTRSPSGERLTWEAVTKGLTVIGERRDFLSSLLGCMRNTIGHSPFDDDITMIAAGYQIAD